jgi:hypothetical protein
MTMPVRSLIMLHHSLTKDGTTVSWPAIRRFHTQTQGWQDIGYHFGLELVADPDPAFPPGLEILVGRPLTLAAAACPQGLANLRAFHICVVGNFDLEAPSQALLDRLAGGIVRPLMEAFHIGPQGIVGHRDFNPQKTCPGTLFNLDILRGMIS